MAKIFSVDAMLAQNRPLIEIRGRFYEVRDLTLEDRLRKMVSLAKEQEELEAEIDTSEASGEDAEKADFARIQKTIARGVLEALVDFPEEIALTLTEREFRTLTAVLAQIREQHVPIRSEEKDIDPNLIGPPTLSG